MMIYNHPNNNCQYLCGNVIQEADSGFRMSQFHNWYQLALVIILPLIFCSSFIQFSWLTCVISSFFEKKTKNQVKWIFRLDELKFLSVGWITTLDWNWLVQSWALILCSTQALTRWNCKLQLHLSLDICCQNCLKWVLKTSFSIPVFDLSWCSITKWTNYHSFMKWY